MKVTICGAAGGEVTGSSYLVESSRARTLIDCGMFQGRGPFDTRNRTIAPIDPHHLNAVVLTHAHLDHVGRLPLLVRAGYAGPIYATPATIDFTQLVLEDAGHIQVADAENENRRRERAGRPPVEPLYTPDDVAEVVKLLRPLPYDTPTDVADGMTARLADAGHILGSASIELRVEDGSRTKTIAFSGDVGRWDAPILRDPTPLDHADLVFLESTYGDRDHRSYDDTADEFQDLLKQAMWDREKVLIPAFAIGRTQQVLYFIAELMRTERVPAFPIYLDSPMAIKATEIYQRHQDLFDKEAATLARRQLRIDLRNLHLLQTAAESRQLNDKHDPCVIIAASGMCDAGRMVHHLKHNLWRRGVAVVCVGYMAKGSLGRKLIDGAKRVRILGSTVAVRARISTLGGFSAHAGQSELLRWLEPLAARKPHVALTHGETPQRQALSAKIAERFSLETTLPNLGDTIEL